MANIGLYGIVTPDYIIEKFRNLESFPEEIQNAGIALDDFEKTKIEINKRLYTAEKNLEVAEAVCLLHPKIELKNEAARKAYILTETQKERQIIQKIHIDKMDNEMAKIGFDRDYSTAKARFESALRISHMIAALAFYFAEYKDA